MLDRLLFLLALAGTAVVYADVLVRPGMLLEPVQRALRNWHFHSYVRSGTDATGKVPDGWTDGYSGNYELDNRWWWKLLWGCYRCCAGQWGFWGYLIRYYNQYNFFEHLAFTAFTIIAAIIIHKWTQD